jgi:hypothetical protein
MEQPEQNIPAELRNKDNPDEGLHAHCRVCERYLLNEDTEYYIEKVVRKVPELATEQTLFEFAVCSGCLQELRKSLSQESKKAMEQFFKEKVLESHRQQPNLNPYQAFANKQCLFTGKSAIEFDTYQMAALCRGRKLHPQQPPMIMGDSIMEESAELLSAQTREELNNFTNNNFGWPPEFAKLLSNGDLALL